VITQRGPATLAAVEMEPRRGVFCKFHDWRPWLLILRSDSGLQLRTLRLSPWCRVSGLHHLKIRITHNSITRPDFQFLYKLQNDLI
jgi:hypothetical protein